jgi:DNA-binding CsgD family transcriptional regulator
MGEAKRKQSLENLTAQERECLRLVAQSLSSKEIGRELGISKASVDTYCNRARAKLGVADRRTAARLVVADNSGLTPIIEDAQTASAEQVAPSAPNGFTFAAVGAAAGGLFPPVSRMELRTRIAATVVVAVILALTFGMLLAGMEALNLVASHAYAVQAEAMAHRATR